LQDNMFKIPTGKNNFSRVPLYKNKGVFFCALVICGILLSRVLVNAQQPLPDIQEQILKKLEALSQIQAEHADKLNQILLKLDAIQKELEIVKIRATVH